MYLWCPEISAQAAVFSTYELSETITLALPPEDIVPMAFINRSSQSIVATSVPINKRLRSVATMRPHHDTYPVQEDARNCFVTIFTHLTQIAFRSIADFEGIMLLPTPSSRRLTASPLPIVIDGEQKRLQVPFEPQSNDILMWRFTLFELPGGIYPRSWLCCRTEGVALQERVYLSLYHVP